jgi:hypothetical protein
MRRLLRILLNVAAMLLSALCLTTACMWVRSYWVADHLEWQRADNVGAEHYNWYLVLSSGAGGLGVCRDAEVGYVNSLTPSEAARPVGRWEFDGWTTRRPPVYPTRGFFSVPLRPPGFAIHWEHRPGTVLRDVIVPYWAVVVPTAVLTLLFTRRVRRERIRSQRLRSGRCARCGYDLHGNVSGVCPECGIAVVVRV